jgi:hypothetical protein
MIADDGLRLGEATKRMFDRLAIAFLPQRVHFKPTLANKARFSGEGTRSARAGLHDTYEPASQLLQRQNRQFRERGRDGILPSDPFAKESHRLAGLHDKFLSL